MRKMQHLEATDPKIHASIQAEIQRQCEKIELIASENFVSEAVLEAMGTPLTNKYAEGYPGRRYYGGCEHVDVAEQLAIDRAKALFGAEHANVQPHSGAQANMAVYFSVMEPNDTLLGMDLSHGGHLTHGMAKNISGKYYNVVSYGVDPVHQRIDYDQLRKKARECRPKMIVAGASAYPREIQFKPFYEIAKETNAYLMVDMAHIAGLVAARLHDDPIPYADFVTTTTHKTLRGPRGGLILCKAEHAKKIDSAVFPGIQGGPLMHMIAAKAVSFQEAMQESFITYQKKILNNAQALAEAMIDKGFDLVSGGTDTHLILVDLTQRDVTGKLAQALLDDVNITVNKNGIPFDTKSPFVTSGIRIGTPAVTTRGFTEDDMRTIADLIDKTLTDSTAHRDDVCAQVSKLTARYPLYE